MPFFRNTRNTALTAFHNVTGCMFPLIREAFYFAEGYQYWCRSADPSNDCFTEPSEFA